MNPSSLARRRWLQRSLLGSAAALGAGSLANLLLATRPAYAADYRALVCVFLYGGNDGMNMVVPTDSSRYTQYSHVRAALALPQTSLLPLAGSDYGLHPAMGALQSVWNAGQLAPVFNVGPLYRPLSKTEFRAATGAPDVPDSLFSHSDQQVLWESASTDAQSRTGWGGRASEALATVNPVIAIGGGGRFGLSSLQAPLVLPGPGGTFGAYGMDSSSLAWTPMQARKNALDALYADAEINAIDNRLTDAMASVHRDAFAKSARLDALVKAVPGDGNNAAIDASFAALIEDGELATPLAEQLYQVAKLVAGNATVQGNRQIFFVQMNGFDTHSGQVSTTGATAGSHALLMGQLADALGAFQSALNALGLGPQVTTFTQSDFGRTFAPNASLGTDHAWGNHQLVMGGAVQGSRTYGSYPTLELGGSDDVGVQSWERQGRWIPSSSVDQYAATLLRWFGASDSQLLQVLPNLGNFSNRNLGFV
jgi:uncharacterized protein (DUF1501 family)